MRSAKLLLFLLCASFAGASGPRWLTIRGGIIWYTTDVHYFTDQGPLSPTVDNATAVALVDSAAAPWGNVVNSTLFLRRGGSLDEDVSAANVTMNASGPVFPADATPANYTQKPLAIVFDYDGAITDLLLGQGASDPTLCLQNAVTECIDLILAPNHIGHAVLVLNGRCTGSHEQQLQLQYQLMRAFGRVLGLGWSQTNDNVFTGIPTPNYQQALHWPIMHPIDILCGPYPYQCLPNPFQLRPDDVGSVDLLYFHTEAPTADGKTYTLQNSADVDGHVSFPNGQGMSGVNMVVQGLSPATGFLEYWETSSSVTGFGYRVDLGNTTTGWLTTPMGIPDAPWEGYYRFGYLPVPAGDVYKHFRVTMQPVNPLYTGSYAVGPYKTNEVAPSGTLISQIAYSVRAGTVQGSEITVATAPADCGPYQTGTEQSPLPTAPSGFWTGRFCGATRMDWSTFTVKAGHTFTVEATALDEQQRASAQKVVPVIGIWNASDKIGTPATQGFSLSPSNTPASGTTALPAVMPTPRQLRMAISDIRSNIRPDFAFQARILYADTVAPVRIPSTGGLITVLGTGFRVGSKVGIGGTDATVQGVTATAITALAPPLLTVTTKLLDITITDPATGGIASIPAAVSYIQVSSKDTLSLVTAPTSPTKAGSQSTAPFSVKLITWDNKPVVNATITFTVPANTATLSPCGTTTCIVSTNAAGVAAIYPTPTVAGVITLQAASPSASSVTTQMLAVDPVRALIAVRATQYVAAGTAVPWSPSVRVTQETLPIANQPITWTAQTGAPVFTAASVSNSLGIAATKATTEKLAPGAQDVLTACAWTTICTTASAQGVASSDWFLAFATGANQSVKFTDAFTPLIVRVTDHAGNAVAGVPAEIHQTVTAWQPPCPPQGRCPIPPTVLSVSSAAVSDEDGLIQIAPASVATMAGDTHIVVAAGTQGYAITTLTKTP